MLYSHFIFYKNKNKNKKLLIKTITKLLQFHFIQETILFYSILFYSIHFYLSFNSFIYYLVNKPHLLTQTNNNIFLLIYPYYNISYYNIIIII